MKLQFDGSQDYQLHAIQAVIDVFDGQPLCNKGFEFSYNNTGSLNMTERGIGNNLVITDEQLLQNIRKVQEKNAIQLSETLEIVQTDKGEILTGLNITVEMETGTGKTYTYLRTIYELNRIYGFTKFIIVVPSVAIREGTKKNLDITHEHFQSIYNNVPINHQLYDRGKITALRNYAMSNSIQVLVINIDSFTKDSNIINTIRETGVKPIEYLQATNPIVIVDEPQNMETDVRKKAIANLNPLCTIRYSATHRNLYNLVYNLNPVQAYDLGLVKQIEVDGITSDENYNAAYIAFKGIESGKKTLKAKLGIYSTVKNGVRMKTLKVEAGADLYLLSGSRDTYKNGYILQSIDDVNGKIEFANNLILYTGQISGGMTDEVVKYQIERTIKWHFEKERRYWQREQKNKIKVLSLFFIDKVSNYREYDSQGNAIPGKYARWFEEIFSKYANEHRTELTSLFYPSLPAPFFDAHKAHETDIPALHPDYWKPKKVHHGYFSEDNGRYKDTTGETQADVKVYDLIMRHKERLLSFDEPLRFIFSHSALREGWDNPNVFQICTLNESKSDIKKRQEIGRGLRLSVDNTGERVLDKRINVLTVIANESYEEFTVALQSEIKDETSIEFKDKVKNAREKTKVQLTKELTPENCPLFFDIWNRINQRTRYRVEFSTKVLINRTVTEIRKMPAVIRPRLEARAARLSFTSEGIVGSLKATDQKGSEEVRYEIPDVYGYIQQRVDITRGTIFQVLKHSGRITDLAVNPQMFLDNVVNIIQSQLKILLVEGVKYEKINGKYYEMTLFEREEIETYLSALYEVNKPGKTLYNYVPVDSNIESNFARDCEADERVKFYFKIPSGFKIPTPLGSYVPDWALILGHDKQMYFVIETKGTLDAFSLRGEEFGKFECGKKSLALYEPDGVHCQIAVTTKDLNIPKD